MKEWFGRCQYLGCSLEIAGSWRQNTFLTVLIYFHLVQQSGRGAGQVYAWLGNSNWSALPSHAWRATNRIFLALKVKCLSRLDYKVKRNRTSKVLSKTRGQMSTWLLFSSFTIWSLQMDYGWGIWSRMTRWHYIWIVNASMLSCPARYWRSLVVWVTSWTTKWLSNQRRMAGMAGMLWPVIG